MAPPASVATHTKTIGVIHPPQDIRKIVDTTASYVAKNGQDFQINIMRYAQNSKVSFLKASDPYHAYYQQRLFEYRDQASVQPTQDFNTCNATADHNNNAEVKPDPSGQFRSIREPLVPPEAEEYTIGIPAGITYEEMDIIKLTAQFVARNGESFLSELKSREGDNLQFQFMRPTNSMFMFFTKLVAAYSKVLIPPKGLSNKLKNGVDSMTTVLERCLCRLEWENSQEVTKQKVEDEMEQERLQMAMIDWHDFSDVVDIDFVDNEDDKLPPPMTLQEVTRRSKMSTLKEEAIEPRPQLTKQNMQVNKISN
ncbi:putative splicing factor 3A subunit 1 [Apium graveolens]|uniref:putative splicing factor 3A subunit 1 n=1 Tax=Apium graveolens TaxID=4045 RepID=UPI003D7B6F2A